MHLYALDHQDTLIFSKDAQKNKDYFCIECQKIVRLKKGLRRHPHFFHLSKNSHCTLFQKSQKHVHIQMRLQKMLGEECELEKRFLDILRIADVFWKKNNVIFEVQCSLISEIEVQKRIQDYESIGCHVIWLLDEKKFNLSRMPKILKNSHRYFFQYYNKRILFYDQWEVWQRDRKRKKGKKLPIDLATIYKKSNYPSQWKKILPKQVLFRLDNQPFFFKGDLVHRSIRGSLLHFSYLKKLEKESKSFVLYKCIKFYEKLIDAALKYFEKS